MKKPVRILLYLVGAAFIIFLLIQLVPYGRMHTNPPVLQEPKWNSPETRAMFQTSCFNCHSNETYYPWYAYVAPSSWLLEYDVVHARSAVNFSEWDPQLSNQIMANRIKAMIDSNRMPPWYFLLLHNEARLDAAKKQTMYNGLLATFGLTK
jgi:hypothetical protein